MKQLLKDYFTFNKKERNGILVLIFIIIILIIQINAMQLSDGDKKNVDFSAFEKEITKLLEAQAQEAPPAKAYPPRALSRAANNRQSPEYFTFNPNDIKKEEWEKLGLTNKQINTIKNYQSKGGRFYTKEDLKKIYSIDASLYKKLEPYINIPETVGSFKHNPKVYKKNYNDLIIEINKADKEDFIKLKGLGERFADRIIKYRTRLGGFISKSQLMEVYGLDSTLFSNIKSQLILVTDSVNRINLNKCEAAELKTHPYLNWNIANAIVNYRMQHGNYSSPEEIKKTDLVNDELYLKIAPYIYVE